MEDFSRHHPGAAVTRTFKGDRDYVSRYNGEANKLLYQLRVLMSFRSLGQLKMVRQLPDGTVITVKSIKNQATGTFQDFVHIDSSTVGLRRAGCCAKPPDLREVELWWENSANGGDPVTYTINGEELTLYLVPASVSWDDIETYTLYTIPEIIGGCVPMTWTLDGEGDLTVDPAEGKFASFATSPDSSECDELEITVLDNCQTPAVVSVISCCDDEDYELPSISYTSLIMGVDTQQTLTVVGGCGDTFSWLITAGEGELSAGGNSREIVYTAPETNPGCEKNPTIQVTDCCGNVAQIKLSVTITSGLAYVQYFWHQTDSGTNPWNGDPWVTCGLEGQFRNCIGNYYDPLWTYGVDCTAFVDGEWRDIIGYLTRCGAVCNTYEVEWQNYLTFGSVENCTGWTCGVIQGCCHTAYQILDVCRKPGCAPASDPVCCTSIPIPHEEHVDDLRTQALIDQGCCPINPETGLPF